MKMNIFKKDKNNIVNRKMGKAVFIIPAAAVAMVLAACIIVTVTAKNGRHDEVKNDKAAQNISKNNNSSIDGSEVDDIELVKKEEIKASNVTENETETSVNPSKAGDSKTDEVADSTSDGGKSKAKDTSSGNNHSTGKVSGNTVQPGNTNSYGSNASSDKNSGNAGTSNSNNSTSQGGSAASEPPASEPAKNEYVAPGWIYYGSKAGNGMTGEQKAYLDSVVKQWTNGSISDEQLADMLDSKVDNEWGITISSMGVSQGDRCIYPSRNDIPDYDSALAESYGIYNFTGLYTKGEYDEYGYLICYMWGVGIF